MIVIEECYGKLGELMYQARTKKGLTTEGLSVEFRKNRLKLNRSSVTRIEQGYHRVTLHALPIICKVLDLKMKDLLSIFVNEKPKEGGK